MGQQSNKVIKRRRRAVYLKRKQELAKLEGIVKKPTIKKSAASTPAKKAPAKKAAAKKAPAKKVATKSVVSDNLEAPELVEEIGTEVAAPVEVIEQAPEVAEISEPTTEPEPEPTTEPEPEPTTEQQD